MLIYLCTSPSCHTATQWQSLKKVQHLIGEELSWDASALTYWCVSSAKCNFILAPDFFFPNHQLCQMKKLVLLSTGR